MPYIAHMQYIHHTHTTCNESSFGQGVTRRQHALEDLRAAEKQPTKNDTTKMLLDHFRHSLRMDGIYSLNVSPKSAICTMASKLQHQPVRTIFDDNEPTQLALENIEGWDIEDESSLVSHTRMWYFRVVHANPSAHNRMHRTSDTLGDCVHHQTVHCPVTL